MAYETDIKCYVDYNKKLPEGLPTFIQEYAKQLEEYDSEEYYFEYVTLADELYITTKDLYAKGRISLKDWEDIKWRYGIDG
ncbi:MAG: hypothetical protein IJ619_10505 [Eubacterium sp.]|nr:hypothetical protein [Eubacterium sp.]